MAKKLKLLFPIILIATVFAYTVMPKPSDFAYAETEQANPSKDPVAAIVQSYVRNDGSFELSADSRLYIDSIQEPEPELVDTVRIAAEMFAARKLPTTDPLQIVYGRGKSAKAGDIVIHLENRFATEIETADKDESYGLILGDKAELTACDTDGIYYGTITLMQLAQYGSREEGIVSIDACSIEDGPDIRERTVFLDCGRKYFSPEWIKNYIRRSSYQKYNAIELHFTEAEGIRFDSEVFPWLTSWNKSISRDEMSDIIRTAHRYHMDVIPSIDTPGHNVYLVDRYANYAKKHPKFSFECDGVTYDRKTKGFKSIANHYSYNGHKKVADYVGIDVTKPHAVAFMNALLDDYADFFAECGCNKFNLGGDELLGWYEFDLGGRHFNYFNRWNALQHWGKYARKELGIKNGTASDTFINYLNETAERLEKKGYVCRVFNDSIDLNKGQHLKLSKSIELDFWTAAPQSAKKYSEQGYSLYNCVSMWSYYVVRAQDGDIMNNKYISVNSANIYNNWKPKSFSSTTKRKYIPDENIGGAYFFIWCDHPNYKSTTTVWKETLSRTWANSVKMWNTQVNTESSGCGKALRYKDFVKYTNKQGNYPGSPANPNKEYKTVGIPEIIDVTTWWQRLLGGFGL